MTTNDERLLQLIRWDRWLQRRNPRRLLAETTALAIGFACLADVLTVLSLEWFPPDPARPIVYDFAWRLDATGLSPWAVVLGWVAGVVLVSSVEVIQWRRECRALPIPFASQSQNFKFICRLQTPEDRTLGVDGRR
jgi:hypothetical protein